LVLAALLAPVVAPHSPFDLSTISIIDANMPPAWRDDGDSRFLLGTDNQGRDILSTILYGMRISIGVGVLSVLLALTLVVALGLSYWVQYARTVRGSTMVERNKDYVQAARLVGLTPVAIMFKHVLPNVTGPVLVIATINLALAIITEATLSFLGVGLPP